MMDCFHPFFLSFNEIFFRHILKIGENKEEVSEIKRDEGEETAMRSG